MPCAPVGPPPLMMPMAFPVSPLLGPGGMPLVGPGGLPAMDGTQAWIFEVQAMASRLNMLAASVPPPLLSNCHDVETGTAHSMGDIELFEAAAARLEVLRAEEAAALDAEAAAEREAEKAEASCT